MPLSSPLPVPALPAPTPPQAHFLSLHLPVVGILGMLSHTPCGLSGFSHSLVFQAPFLCTAEYYSSVRLHHVLVTPRQFTHAWVL